MTDERFFVTGASGCIGAWVVRNLVKEGVPTTVLDRGSSRHRLELILTDQEIARVRFISGDVSDLSSVERAVRESGATRIIHLAAMQVPFCKVDPALGARVNVAGTVHIFEAAKRARIRQVVYASSAAVYGAKEDYPEGILRHDAPLKPRTHYGVYKQANEGTARVYWMDDRIASIGLRPYVVYGPGRDRGMTSTPTMAMLAAAAGRSYRISFGGRFDFQYVDDVAKIFILAARTPFEGADAFNLAQASVDVPAIIAAIEAAEPSRRGTIIFDDVPLPFPEGFDNSVLGSVLGKLPETPLIQGVRETLSVFKQTLSEGRIPAETLKEL